MGLEGWDELVHWFERVGLGFGFGFGLERKGRRHKTTSGANPKHGCTHVPSAKTALQRTEERASSHAWVLPCS